MPALPSIDNLFLHYPFPQGDITQVANLIGGTVGANLLNPNYPAYKETCAIRISRALNYAGDPIPPIGQIDNPLRKGEKLRADKGADGKRYIFSTYDIRAYLNMRYGFAKKFPPNTTSDELSALKGIIAFGYVHIDLWNGSGCARFCLFGHSGISGDNILVWEAK